MLLLAGRAAGMLVVIAVLSLLAALFALRTPPSPVAPARAPKGQSGTGLLTGWRTIRSLPALGWLVTGLTLSNLATGLLQAAGPVIVVKHFGHSTTAVGLVWSAAAGASLLAVTFCRFAIDRLGLWPVGAVCAALASLACLAVAQAPDYLSYLVLIAVLMAGDGGMTVVLRTLRSRLIPADAFGATLSRPSSSSCCPSPSPACSPRSLRPTQLGHVITVCAVLQALGLFCAFTRLRTDPALRT